MYSPESLYVFLRKCIFGRFLSSPVLLTQIEQILSEKELAREIEVEEFRTESEGKEFLPAVPRFGV